MVCFEKYSEIYNLIYSDKDYSKETDYIVKKLQQYNCKSKELLEYGSGTGVHGSLLVQKGYKVTGIEISKNMYQIAKSRIDELGINNKFNLINDNIVTYRDNKKYGAVISLFHVISYITSNENLFKVFENASYQLEIGGLFIFDIWYLPAVLTLKPQFKIKIFENDLFKIFRFTEPKIRYNENIVDVNFKFVIIDKQANITTFFEEIHPMRYLSFQEIKFLAELNSFEILKAEEFLTEKEPSESTWGICFILRKKYE